MQEKRFWNCCCLLLGDGGRALKVSQNLILLFDRFSQNLVTCVDVFTSG